MMIHLIIFYLIYMNFIFKNTYKFYALYIPSKSSYYNLKYIKYSLYISKMSSDDTDVNKNSIYPTNRNENTVKQTIAFEVAKYCNNYLFEKESNDEIDDVKFTNSNNLHKFCKKENKNKNKKAYTKKIKRVARNRVMGNFQDLDFCESFKQLYEENKFESVDDTTVNIYKERNDDYQMLKAIVKRCPNCREQISSRDDGNVPKPTEEEGRVENNEAQTLREHTDLFRKVAKSKLPNEESKNKIIRRISIS